MKTRIRDKEFLEGELRYELASGVHTYHNCKCGRKKTRAGRCSLCLEEELARLEAEDE